MPNFHTHWIVALQATTAAPGYVNDGRERYVQSARQFNVKLQKILNTATDQSSKSEIRESIRDASNAFADRLRTSAALPGTWDDVACFSAYMLGACGPDFWTLPSESRFGWIPDFAGKHFDLGHYNRTHRQFQVSVSRLAGRDDLQARLEKSYFLGMATHVAGDLVIHELVNVYAGAYNLLEKKWENEQGYLTKNIWSTHNKVEHYWDTYVRYRFLGDYGEVFGGDGRSPGAAGTSWVPPLELPTIESLTRWVRDHRQGKAREALLGALGQDDVKYAVEKPLMFPWVVCDRICAQGDLSPFVYSVVVNKQTGAYPQADVYELAGEEASSFQMTDRRPDADRGHSERKKLEFFTTARNQGTASTAHNYLTYIVCPDLEKLKKFGGGDFYELRALGPFVQRAGQVAATFVRELTGAYAHPQSRPPDAVALANLARFWNLDTGLGLQVRKVRSHLRKEVITQLDFVHVFELGAGSGPVGFERCRDGEGYLEVEEAEFEFPRGQRAFETYRAEPFEGIAAIQEADRELLEWVPLAKPQANAMKATPLDRIFDEGGASSAPVCEVATMKVTRSDAQGAACSALQASEGEAQVVCQEIFDRLNLWLRVPIPSLGRGREQLGMFLWADKKRGLDGAEKELPEPTGSSTGLRAEPVTTHEWFAGVREAKGLLDYRDVPDEDEVAARYGLEVFSTRILANLLPEDLDAKRKNEAGSWNGVVPFAPHQDHYGRNFVIGTGRSLVLRPTDGGTFAGRADFGKWSNVFPTEQVFFTLFPLVRTEKGVFDVFSRKQVKKAQLDELKRIDATGFVKIVLFFEIGRDGSAQVDECYVDGLRVPVA